MTALIDHLTQIYRLTARSLFALPLAFALPVMAEAVQHLVEFWLGMFISGDGIQPGRETAIRMGFGVVKIAAILFTVVVMARYFLHDFDRENAMSFSRSSRSAILASILFMIVLIVLAIIVSPWIDTLAESHLPFIPNSLRRFIPALVLLGLTHPIQKKTFCVIAAILDDVPLDDVKKAAASKALLRNSWLPLLIAVAPAMALHYKLNSLSVDAEFSTKLALLIADSLLVGAMSVLIAAATFRTYHDAKLSAHSRIDDVHREGNAKHE